MKNRTENDDMPDEIDFTGGVRGKYAGRYREGVTIRESTPLDPIAFYETQSRLGYALWHAQTLEAALVAYLSLVEEMAVHEAGARAHKLLEHASEEKQLRNLWPSLENLTDLTDRIRRALSERNWIVHRCSFELAGLVDSPTGRRDVAVRLEGFADEARYLSQHLLNTVHLTLSQRGMTHAEIDKRTEQVIEAWATPAA